MKYLISILGIIVLAGLVFAVVNRAPAEPISDPIPTPSPGPITIQGEITCLPKTGDGPHTLECAIGLQGDDGNYYGLPNLFNYDPSYHFSTTGLRVEVSGVFEQKPMVGPGSSTYDVAGVIEISSIKEIVSDGDEIRLQEGEREISFLLQKIYPDRVEGLNFMEYPVAMEQGLPLTLRVGEVVSNGCTVRLTLVRIEEGAAFFTVETNFNQPCPICLAAGTMIDTPMGMIPVENLQRGMPVWTIDAAGTRVAGIVLEASKTLAPSTHQVVRLVLDDGREIFVSPGHPASDGRRVGELSVGDLLDGGRVLSVERVPYEQAFTYDILPSGPSGLYWANGILLGSTLAKD